MKISNFRGDLTDISAKKEALPSSTRSNGRVAALQPCIQVCLDKSDRSVPKNVSNLSKSEMNRTEKKAKKCGSVETGALASSFRCFWATTSIYKHCDTTGDAGVPYYAQWFNHLLIRKVTRVRFFPYPNIYVSLISSNCHPLDVQVSDTQWNLELFAGA